MIAELVRFMLFVLKALFVIILLFVGMGLFFFEHQRAWGGGLWLLALLIMAAGGKDKKRRPSSDHRSLSDDWGNEPPSERQISFARHLGIHWDSDTTMAELSGLIDAALAEERYEADQRLRHKKGKR